MVMKLGIINLVMMTIYCGNKGVRSESIFLPGVSDFSKVVECKAFVDKSLLIFEVINYKFVHITTPRRFGRSTNLDMVKRFVEIDLDENGQPKETNKTVNFKLFEKNNLKIFEYKDFVVKHFGRYPVIYIDFNGFKDINNFDAVLSRFISLVEDSFRKHKYLLKNSTLFDTPEKMDLFQKYSNGNVKLTTEKQIISAFKFLTKCLQRQFRKRVFFFIDDYDSHVKSLLFKPCSDLNKIITFIHSIFEEVIFDNDDYVFGAMLTGELRVNILGTLSHYHHITFLQHEDITQYYGITESELDKLLVKTVDNIKLRKETKCFIEDFYKGYNVIDSEPVEYIYNTWSVLNYLGSLKAGKDSNCYWCQEDDFEVLRHLLSLKGMRRVVKRLLMGKNFWINVNKPINRENIFKINSVIRSVQTKMKPKLLQFSINLLYHFGFVTVVANSTKIFNEFRVHVPNKEIEIALKKAYSDKNGLKSVGSSNIEATE